MISPNQSSFGPNVHQKHANVRLALLHFDITMQNLKLFTASCRGICALFSRFSRSGVVSHGPRPNWPIKTYFFALRAHSVCDIKDT